MLSKKSNIVATSDKLTIFPKSTLYSSIEIVYSGFASAGSVDSQFQIVATNRNPAPKLADIADWLVVAGTLTEIADASGKLLFEFIDPIAAEFIGVQHTANSVNDGTYDVYYKEIAN